MATKLTKKANEGGTFGFMVTFIEVTTDGEPGTPITPKAGLRWTLKDKDGNVINDKEDQSLTPASSVIIVLSGLDLILAVGVPEERYVTIEGTYDSVLGSDLEFVDEVSFQIENLVGVPSI